MHRFVKLEVYQKALKFTGEIYRFSNKLPSSEKFGIIDQLRRATVSIVLNIAEGAGAGSNPEFGRFLKMSLRSTYEVNAVFDIIEELGLDDTKTVDDLRKKLDEISAMIVGLMKSLKMSEY